MTAVAFHALALGALLTYAPARSALLEAAPIMVDWIAAPRVEPKVEPPRLALSIAADGSLFWNGEQVERAALRERLAQAAQRRPQPEVHLRADRATHYQSIAEVMADSAAAGMRRIGFVSEPDERR